MGDLLYHSRRQEKLVTSAWRQARNRRGNLPRLHRAALTRSLCQRLAFEQILWTRHQLESRSCRLRSHEPNDWRFWRRGHVLG